MGRMEKSRSPWRAIPVRDDGTYGLPGVPTNAYEHKVDAEIHARQMLSVHRDVHTVVVFHKRTLQIWLMSRDDLDIG